MYKITAFLEGKGDGKEFDTAEFWLSCPPRVDEYLWFIPKGQGEEYYFKVTKVRHPVIYKREKVNSTDCIIFEFEEPSSSEEIEIEAVHIDRWI